MIKFLLIDNSEEFFAPSDISNMRTTPSGKIWIKLFNGKEFVGELVFTEIKE